VSSVSALCVTGASAERRGSGRALNGVGPHNTSCWTAVDRSQGAADWHPAPKPVLEAAAAARRAAESYGVDIGTLAIKESVSAPGVAVHLMGMKTVEEVGGPPLRCLSHRAACPVCRALSWPKTHVGRGAWTRRQSSVYTEGDGRWK